MSRCHRLAILALPLSLAGSAALLAAGCQTPMTPLPAGGEIHIEPDQGLLIVETLSNSKVELLRLSESNRRQATHILEDIPEGRQVQLVALPEGDYHWDRIELPGVVFNNRSYPMRWELDRAEQWQVSIKAGEVSYPGMIVLHRSKWSYLSYRVLNRSGELLESINELFPGLFEQYPVRYGGAGRDDFLEYYRETLRSNRPTEAIPDQETPLAPSGF